jgi:hypothetical protein
VLEEIPGPVREALTQSYRSLNPAELKRAIGRCQERLIAMARSNTKSRKEVSRPPVHPIAGPCLRGRLEDIFGDATDGCFEDILT